MAGLAQPDIPQQWDALLSKHHSILAEHLKLWESIRKKSNPGTNPYVTAEQCWNDTSNMIENFQRLQTSFEPREEKPMSNKRQAVSQVEGSNFQKGALSEDYTESRKKRRRTDEQPQPTQEASNSDNDNLFTIDINPTAVEDLISSTATQTKGKEKHTGKRRLSESKAVHAIGLDEPFTSGSTSDAVNSSKRVRRTVVNVKGGPDHINVKTSNRSNNIPTEQDQENDEEDAKVMAKLTAKQAEKAAKKQLKRERKRKRESTPSLEDHAQADVQPFKKKRQKGSQSKDTGDRSLGDASSSTTQPDQKVKKKHNHKPKHKIQGSRKEKR